MSKEEFEKMINGYAKLFSVHPKFFKGIVDDDLIEEQEQKIQETVGDISVEDRIGMFREMSKEENV